MDKAKLDDVYNGLRAQVESLGFDCAGFELVVENGLNILRVYVDLPGGVNLADCETVAREVGTYLDEHENSLPDKYFLEVSSPGLERPLFTPDDYARFAGKEAQLSIKGNKKVTGVISHSADAGFIRILTTDGEKVVPFSDIKRGRLLYKEEKGQKKTFKKIPKKK